MIHHILKLIRWISRIGAAGAALIIILMMVNITGDVVGRTILHRPIHGTLEFTESIYMVCLCFLPMLLVQSNRDHLLIELFIRNKESKVGRWSTFAGSIVAAAVCGLIAWQTILIAINKTRIREIVYLTDHQMEVWWVRWVIAFVFSMLTIIIVLQIIEDILKLVNKNYVIEADAGAAMRDTEANIEVIS